MTLQGATMVVVVKNKLHKMKISNEAVNRRIPVYTKNGFHEVQGLYEAAAASIKGQHWARQGREWQIRRVYK